MKSLAIACLIIATGFSAAMVVFIIGAMLHGGPAWGTTITFNLYREGLAELALLTFSSVYGFWWITKELVGPKVISP